MVYEKQAVENAIIFFRFTISQIWNNFYEKSYEKTTLFYDLFQVLMKFYNVIKFYHVLMLIFPGKNAFGIKESFLKTTRRNFLYFDKSLITIADQVFTEKGYKKEICRILESEWIRIQNIAQKDLLFSVTTYSLSTSKITYKE